MANTKPYSTLGLSTYLQVASTHKMWSSYLSVSTAEKTSHTVVILFVSNYLQNNLEKKPYKILELFLNDTHKRVPTKVYLQTHTQNREKEPSQISPHFLPFSHFPQVSLI